MVRPIINLIFLFTILAFFQIGTGQETSQPEASNSTEPANSTGSESKNEKIGMAQVAPEPEASNSKPPTSTEPESIKETVIVVEAQPIPAPLESLEPSLAPPPETSLQTPPPSSIREEDDTDANAKSVKSEIMKALVLNDKYDKYVRPAGRNGSGPVLVYIGLMLRSVENINDEDMEYTTQLTFREEWHDPRLRYDHLHKVEYIQLSTYQSIWVPDVFFSNEKSGSIHELMQPNFFGRIYSDGKVMVSYRITLVLSCPMKLHYFPMDKQDCYIRMTSYGWTSKDIVLTWPETEMELRKFEMPRFRLIKHSRLTCSSVTKTGNYSCIELKLRFERRFGYYLIQIYAPCVMLVLVSWISFWLEPTATEARVSLAITAVLTVVTQTDGINQSVPPASYIKAVDVWAFMIQFMVFAVVLQFAYVNYLANYHWRRIARRLNITDEDEWTKMGCELRRQTEKQAKRVDHISKLLFPAVFGLFNIVYWATYLGTHPA